MIEKLTVHFKLSCMYYKNYNNCKGNYAWQEEFIENKQRRLSVDLSSPKVFLSSSGYLSLFTVLILISTTDVISIMLSK